MRDFKGMKRQRGRNRSSGGNLGGKPQQQNANRAFDSNGPENMKVRGHAQHVFEKYQQLARDATSSGDRVLAENFLQHAEHYFRLLRTLQPNRPISDFIARDNFASGYDIDFEDESGAQALPEEQPSESENDGQGGMGGDLQQGRMDYQGQSRDTQGGQYRDNRDGQQRDGQPREWQSRDGQNRDGQNRDSQNRDGQNRDRWENRQGRDRNNRFDRDRPQGDRPQGDRPQGDRQQGERAQFDPQRDDRPRDDRPRDDRPRDDRGYRSESQDSEPRTESRTEAREDRGGYQGDRPPREGRRDRYENRDRNNREDRGERSDPLAVIEPRAEPLTPAPEPARTPRAAKESSRMLRSSDGEVSHAPAFLQAATPVAPPAGEEAPVKRPRGRPKKVVAPVEES